MSKRDTHCVWSWDGTNRIWMEVAQGNESDMSDALRRKRAAAEKWLPSARFTMTRRGEPPTEVPA